MLQDCRWALRSLPKRPGFVAVVVTTIALAIGANAAMFSIVNGVLLHPLPYPDAERIVRVVERAPDGGKTRISTLTYLDWAEQSTAFEHMAAQTTRWRPTLTGGEEPLQLSGSRVSADYFEILGITPALGRTFASGEDRPGNDHVVVLSHALWQSRFGSDPAILGRSLMLDGEAHIVVGVLGAGGVVDRMPVQIWKPLAFTPANLTRDVHWLIAIAKLEPAFTIDQARAEMDLIGAQIAEEHPDSNLGWSVSIDPLAETLVSPRLRTAIVVLFAATGLVLLLACANVASLSLARGVAREREVVVRASLGATRWRLTRQLLTENVLLSLCGGVAGVVLGHGMLRWIEKVIPPYTLPAEADIHMNLGVLLFALTAAVLSGLLFGLAPVMQAARTNLIDLIKDGGHGATPGRSRRRMHRVLVASQVALAFVLLVSSGKLFRSLSNLLDVDLGFDSSNVLTAALPLPQERHPDPEQLNEYLDSIRATVAAVPGVRETAIASVLPLEGWRYGMPYQVAGRGLLDRARRPVGFFKMVSPSYFDTLGIRLLAGRPLSEADSAGAPPVMLINETLAKRAFPGERAIGQRMLVQQIVPGRTELGDEIAWEIVGIIADERIDGLADNESGGMYVSNRQSPVYDVSLLVGADVDPQSLIAPVRAAIDTVNRDQAMSRIRTLEQIVSESVGGQRFQTLLLGAFAGIALLLATVGVHGVVAHSVAQRVHEMGIRAALGANARHLQGLVLRDGMHMILNGLAVGLIGAAGAMRVMRSMLFGVTAYEPVTLLVAAATLVTAAGAACFVPARRVARAEPNVALRSDG
jgi:putative ABC transport system permease protein